MIITFLSDKLIERYPNAVSTMLAISRHENAYLRILEGTRDIWIRDYMPIVLPSGAMVQFEYRPSYLINGYEHLITPSGLLKEQFGFPAKRSKLNIDGGNYVRVGNKVLMCDRMFQENSNIQRDELLKRLKYLLQAEEILVLPTHPFDPVGHADGIVAAVNDKSVMIDELSPTANAAEISFHETLKACLEKTGLKVWKCPVEPPPNGYLSDWDCRGSYLNHITIGRTLVIPVYNHTSTIRIMNFFIALFPNNSLWLVNCEEIAKEGGALHCATWTA